MNGDLSRLFRQKDLRYINERPKFASHADLSPLGGGIEARPRYWSRVASPQADRLNINNKSPFKLTDLHEFVNWFHYVEKTTLPVLSPLYLPVFRPPRPLGVTVLAVLEIIAGIVDIVFGLLFIAIYSMAITILGMGVSSFGFFLVPLIALFFVVGFLSLILSYGLWTGKGWAWVSAIVLAIIGMVTGLIGLLFGSYLNIIPIAFYLMILVYLGTRSVRAFFGHASPYWPPGPAFPSGPYPPPPYAPVVQPGYAPSPQSAPPQYGPGMAPAYPPFPQNVQQPYFPEQPSGIAFHQPFRRTGMCPVCLSPVELGARQCFRCGSRLR